MLCILESFYSFLDWEVANNRPQFRPRKILYEQIWPQGYKLFLTCSTQLSTKFQLLITTKIPTNKEVYCFKSLICCSYLANKCSNANNCWHFNICEPDKIPTQLSWVWKKFYNLGTRLNLLHLQNLNCDGKKNAKKSLNICWDKCKTYRFESEPYFFHPVRAGDIEFDTILLVLEINVRVGFTPWNVQANMTHDVWFPTMWRFDKCRLWRACEASF